jgi:DNA-binding NtrC family response regulator
MSSHSLLCVNLAGDASALVKRLKAAGWDVMEAADLQEALRLQAHLAFAVSLLLMDSVRGRVPADGELDACIRAAPGTEWVAVCDRGMLESTPFRDLVVSFFFCYLLAPAEAQLIDLLLQQAWQLSVLRRQHRLKDMAVVTDGMVGQGPAMLRLREQIRKVATNGAPVLIGGESGSGKELAAQAIHRRSPRSGGPFIAVNCGAISPLLIHSELFGHERGAFTGASAQRSGLIEAAHGGTVFLDEIGDLPLELQTNLLRFLQEKTINRVGAVRSITVDARVVAASHVDLAEAVAKGRFREDLYYRLNVLRIEVPPLRNRMEDVPLLAEHFLRACASEASIRVDGFRRQAVAALLAHHWPGNVRELHNSVRRAVVMADQRLIGPADLGLATPERAWGGLDAARTAAERDVISVTLSRVGRNITTAARELGVSRMTLYRLMDKHRIQEQAEAGEGRGAVGATGAAGSAGAAGAAGAASVGL